jgi:hypothetical protein
LKRLFLLLCLSGVLLNACGDHRDDPKKAYGELVTAAHAGDGGTMYELLDHKYRTDVDTMMVQQASMADQMPAEEKAKWEALKGLKGKEAFAKMLSLNRDMMTARFKGDYDVLKVDTVVVLTVQHKGQPADLMYMRWEDGKYRVTAPPSVPAPASMPQGHPNVQGGPQGSAPQGAPQEAPAPQHPVPADTARK